VVAESPKGTKVTGKTDIEELVNTECQLFEDKKIVIGYLKWSLERVMVRISSLSAPPNKRLE
jgi:hypothetical protein